MSKVSVYIVRGETGGAPESVIYGVYPTKELAEARVEFLENDEDYGLEFAWYDEVEVGPDGADCELYNR